LAYRASGGTGLMQMRPEWWGILGLIGWAYLVASAVFLSIGPKPAALFGASIALYGLFFVDQTHVLPLLDAIRPVINVGPVLGSHAALVLSGAAVVTWFVQARRASTRAVTLVPRVLLYGIALIAAGLFLHQFHDVSKVFWIHKPMATPAWCLISAGATALTWALLVTVVEDRGWRRWPPAVTIAGQQALLCYLLAPVLGSLLALSAPIFGGNDPYAELGHTLLTGTIRSIVFAWIVVRLAGWLQSRGLRLQL
jgi:predicted acyltransferase